MARFARNVVKWDFLIDFQTTSVCFVFCSTIRPWRRRRPKSHFRNKLLRFFLPSHNVYARISAHTFLFFECVLWYVMSLHHVNCFLILKSLSRLLSMLNVNSTRSTKRKEENLCNNTQNVNIKSHTNGRLHAKSQWFSVFLLTTVFADVYPTPRTAKKRVAELKCLQRKQLWSPLQLVKFVAINRRLEKWLLMVRKCVS